MLSLSADITNAFAENGDLKVCTCVDQRINMMADIIRQVVIDAVQEYGEMRVRRQMLQSDLRVDDNIDFDTIVELYVESKILPIHRALKIVCAE